MKTYTRHYTIIIILLAVSICSLKAQVMNNTRWRSYSQQNTFDLFWNFNNDTVSYCNDNISWIDVSVYTEAGNIITFRDLVTNQCDTIEVGIYQFNILLDTLRFTVISEPCASRMDYLTTYHFVEFPIGINELQRYKNISVYPVPFTHCLNVKAESGSFYFTLFDITGRKVKELSFQGNVKIETEELEPGMYLYELRIFDEVVKSGTAMKY